MGKPCVRFACQNFCAYRLAVLGQTFISAFCILASHLPLSFSGFWLRASGLFLQDYYISQKNPKKVLTNQKIYDTMIIQ
jgi:hypothetical protein